MEDRYEQIEAYLKGNMSTKDRQAFELELLSNEELSREVALHQAMMEGISNRLELEPQETALNQTLEGFGEQYFKGTSVQRSGRRLWAWVGAAAAVVVLLILVVPNLFKDDQQVQVLASSQQILDSYLLNAGELSGSSSARSDSVAQAVELYNQQQYAEALVLLQGLTIADSGFQAERLRAIALSQIQTGKYEEAAQSLQTFEAAVPTLKADAELYRAIILIRQENYTQAIEILTAIDSLPRTNFYPSAEELLQKLTDLVAKNE